MLLKLSVLVPVYNEANTVVTIIKKLLRVRDVHQIVIVDDGSTDETAQNIRQFFKKLPSAQRRRCLSLYQQNKGKGAAIRAALTHASGNYVLIQDADLEYDPRDIPTLLKPIREKKAEVVFGSRFLGPHRNLLFWHWVGNHLINFVTNLLFNTTLSDLETCYKVMPTKLARGLRLRADRFDLEPEITCKILMRGIKIFDVPISYTGRDFSEGKKITWHDGVAALHAVFWFWCLFQLQQAERALTRQRWSLTLPFLFIAAAVVGRFWPMVFGGRTFFFADNFSLFVPQRLFLIESLRRGDFPWWNPYILNGLPYFANMSKGVLYLPTYLFGLLPPGPALNALVLGHLIWGGWGMVWSARRWGYRSWQALLSAVIWMFSTYVVAGLNNLVVTQTLAWLPWMLGVSYGIFRQHQRQWLPWLVLITVAQFLAGHLQPLVYSLGLAGSIALGSLIADLNILPARHRFAYFRDWLSAVIIWGGASVVWVAVLLFPALDFSRQTTRVSTSFQEALSGSLAPAQLLKFVMPYFWSKPDIGMAWGPDWGIMRENGGYVSVLGLGTVGWCLSTLWKTRRLYRFFLLIALGGMCLASGRYFPPVAWLYQHFSVLHALRSPSGFVVWWLVAMAGLIPAALASVSIAKRWVVLATATALIVSATAVIGKMRFEPLWYQVDALLHHQLLNSSFHTLAKDKVIWDVLTEEIVMISVFTILGMWLLFWRRSTVSLPHRQLATLGLVLVIAVDLTYHHNAIVVSAPNDIYVTTSPVAQELHARMTSQDRFATSVGLYPWTGLPSYWENITFQPPFQPSRFSSSEAQTFTELRLRRDLLTTDWGLPYFLPTSFGYSTFVLQRTADAFSLDLPGTNINELDARDFHAPQLSAFGNRYLIIDKEIMGGAFWQQELHNFYLVTDTPTWALYENPQAQPIIRGEGVTIADIHRTNSTLSFTTSASRSATITVAETYEPGWQARIDGQPVPIAERYSMRELPIEAGQHQIEMTYFPRWFWPGLLMTVVGGPLSIWVARWWSKRRSATASWIIPGV